MKEIAVKIESKCTKPACTGLVAYRGKADAQDGVATISGIPCDLCSAQYVVEVMQVPEGKQYSLRIMITEDIKDRLRNLLAVSDCFDIRELLIRCLATYETLVEIKVEGNHLVVQNDSGESLERVAL